MKTLEQRFWPKVRKTSSCWIWIGRLTDRGYGLIGRGRQGLYQLRAHRGSWQLHYGAIPHGLYVCHTCDNRACVNPQHLFLGNQSDNLMDAARKGRMPHVLTPSKVQDIRHRYPELSTGMLAREYGVSRTLISKIIRRELWAHVL